MDTNIKAFELFWQFYNGNPEFRNLIDKYMNEGRIRFFGEPELTKINSQNFMSPDDRMKEFIDMFTLGLNIGNCGGASRQLSFSYNDVSIVSGILPILKGTRNAEKVGGHIWLEDANTIIDTSLMLIIDKNLKDEFGYQEEQRLTPEMLANYKLYQSAKEFANDPSIKIKPRLI